MLCEKEMNHVGRNSCPTGLDLIQISPDKNVRPTQLLDLHQFTRPRFSRSLHRSRPLRIPPEVENRDLMHTGDRAVRGAGFLGEIFAADVFDRVLL